MRLSPDHLRDLPRDVRRHCYDPAAQTIGIVHLGIGAFHRAHQAWYTDRAMDGGERDWAICGVSLRSDSVARQLNPQGGLYSVTDSSASGRETRIVGAVRTVLVAPHDRQAVVAAMASPSVQLVSVTVTEKGYCRAPDGGLDLGQAEQGFYPMLAQALADRRAAGLPGLTLMSCDNLAANGAQLRRLVGDYLDSAAPGLAGWFHDRCACPSSMVDRIVPATSAAEKEAVFRRLGMDDAGAVVTEPFSQWVIEDRFAGGRPGWEKVGVQMVADVGPFETAKLRMLNGSHSALAYLGLERGHVFVHQAIADPVLREIVETLMRREAAESFAPAPTQDLAAYADALLARFENPTLEHRLAQIAMDGSQKVPPRWLETVADRRRRGADSPAILTALAAWVRHVRGDRRAVDDPEAEHLATLWDRAGVDGICEALFGDDGMLKPSLDPIDRLGLRARL